LYAFEREDCIRWYVLGLEKRMEALTYTLFGGRPSGLAGRV